MKIKILDWDCTIERKKFRVRYKTEDGHRYKIRDEGKFVYEPPMPAKIVIDERLKGKKLLEATVHEFIHALNPYVEERFVLASGEALTKLLHDMGFRQTEVDKTLEGD